MAAAAAIGRVEQSIRDTASTRKIRVREFFMDFDKLRSGYITASQFFRTLSLNLGVTFSSEEERLITEKYSQRGDNKVNWRAFAESIEGRFDPADFTGDPSQQFRQHLEYLGTERSVRPLSPSSECRLIPIMSRMNQFLEYQGFILRRCYKDFDLHNVGLITESQFYRNFPGPKDVTDEDMALLVRKYHDPEKPGMVNYLNLYHDLIQLGEMEKDRKEGRPCLDAALGNRVGHDKLPQQRCLSPSVQMIFDRIRHAVYKKGIRVTDFFRDFDKLRHDRVTENQFVCSLSLAVGKEAQLSRGDIQRLANFLRAPDGRIRYKDFCMEMDSPFHVLHLEKDPLKEAPLPPSGSLSKQLQILSLEEEKRVDAIIRAMQEQVKQRRVMVYPFFRDFDMSTAMTHLVTPNQFSRILHLLSLDVTVEDARLLATKFADSVTGEVNYAAFSQAVDSWFTASKQDEEVPPPTMVKDRDWHSIVTPVVKTVSDDVPVDILLSRIRHLVLVNRIRVKPSFEDFDSLRSGRMNVDRFRRCLTLLGMSKIGLHDLTPAQFDTLVNRYRDPNDPKQVVWVDFVQDVDSVFTEPNLETRPCAQVLPEESFVLPKPGTMDWSNASEDLKHLYQDTMGRLRRKVFERRMLVKPDFRAFDKLNHGHVTMSNFRQLMVMLDMHLTDEEMDAVAARFADDEGFNYTAFLEDLDPQPAAEYRFEQRLYELRNVNAKKGNLEMEPVVRDTEAVMDKVKAQVFRRRLRLADFFEDHDKLKHGRMPTATFRRALNSATIHLPETELSLIEDRFRGPEPSTVAWRRFCEEIEGIFATKNLEKDPLLDASVFRPDSEVDANCLTVEEGNASSEAISKIADQVRQRRIQLAPLFQDFDTVHRMTISQTQFRRVLVELDLAPSLSETEWAALYKKYHHKIGISDMINYLAFMDDVYAAGGFQYRTP